MVQNQFFFNSPGGGEQGLPVFLPALPEVLSHDPQLVPKHVRSRRQHPRGLLLLLGLHR